MCHYQHRWLLCSSYSWFYKGRSLFKELLKCSSSINKSKSVWVHLMFKKIMFNSVLWVIQLIEWCVVLCLLFDICSFAVKNSVFEFYYQKMNMFKSVQCSTEWCSNLITTRFETQYISNNYFQDSESVLPKQLLSMIFWYETIKFLHNWRFSIKHAKVCN